MQVAFDVAGEVGRSIPYESSPDSGETRARAGEAMAFKGAWRNAEKRGRFLRVKNSFHAIAPTTASIVS